MIEIMLENIKAVNQKNQDRFDKKKEAQKQKKIEEMKLVEIAEMLNNGVTQKVIADTLGVAATTINYRVKLLRTEYKELLNTKNTKIRKIRNNDNVNDNVNVNENVNDNMCVCATAQSHRGLDAKASIPLKTSTNSKSFKF